MFRPRYRRPPFTDPLNWTDYRWDTGPWRSGAPSALWRSRRWRREHPFIVLLLAGLAAVITAKLWSSIQSRNGSWARRGLYAVLLILIVHAFSRNHRHRSW